MRVMGDAIDFTKLDLQTKIIFSLKEHQQTITQQYQTFSDKLSKEFHEIKRATIELRIKDPILFDQLTIVLAATILEVIASYAIRKN